MGLWLKDNSWRGSAPCRVEVRGQNQGGEGCGSWVMSLGKKVVNLVPTGRAIEDTPREVRVWGGGETEVTAVPGHAIPAGASALAGRRPHLAGDILRKHARVSTHSRVQSSASRFRINCLAEMRSGSEEGS